MRIVETIDSNAILKASVENTQGAQPNQGADRREKSPAQLVGPSRQPAPIPSPRRVGPLSGKVGLVVGSAKVSTHIGIFDWKSHLKRNVSVCEVRVVQEVERPLLNRLIQVEIPEHQKNITYTNKQCLPSRTCSRRQRPCSPIQESCKPSLPRRMPLITKMRLDLFIIDLLE